MVLRSALALTSSVVVHALVFGVMWLQPAPPPPPPPPDGSPVSLAAFDFDDAPTESSSPTPSEVATPCEAQSRHGPRHRPDRRSF